MSRLSTGSERWALSTSARWRAWLTETARLNLEEAAAAAHPKETGGILVGVHTAGSRPWIVHAVEIPSKNSGGAHYVVPARRRRQIVERLRKQHDLRLGYVGEWHSHPLDVGASPTDLDSIRAIADDHDSGCPRPVLLIARRVRGSYVLDARQLDRRSFQPLDLIAAGTLLSIDVNRRTRRSLRGLRTTVVRR
jgi:Prokaryotic homologs of the JAB domain